MVDRASLPYRPCVGITLLNENGQVFVGQRLDHYKAWQMPQGGIDKGEDIETAAFRELKEEVGTDKAELLRIAPETLAYDLPDHLLGRLWGGQYRGQEQSWVAMKFLGEDSDIDLNTHTPPEFGDWQWVHLHETLDLIVPFKRETYKRVIKMFEDLIDL